MKPISEYVEAFNEEFGWMESDIPYVATQEVSQDDYAKVTDFLTHCLEQRDAEFKKMVKESELPYSNCDKENVPEYCIYCESGLSECQITNDQRAHNKALQTLIEKI